MAGAANAEKRAAVSNGRLIARRASEYGPGLATFSSRVFLLHDFINPRA